MLSSGDDFNFLHHPIASLTNEGGTCTYYYSFDLASIKQITNPLGIPWHDVSKKGHDFTFTTEYAGFSWDLPNKCVSLPDKRHHKFLMKLSQFIQCLTVMATQVASIHGSLQHISFVYCDGHAFLPALS
jgi:hypothetical protein